MKLYKIRDINTGLFSTGGRYPRWTKTGKTWSCEGHVKAHLTMYSDKEYNKKQNTIPENWEVIEITLQESMTDSYPARELAERSAKK
jgi:hypothetical protein